MNTPNKAIIRASNRPTDQIIISADPGVIAERLRLMISGGKKLTNDEALALAQYSIATQLNPFEGECYYLAGVGPGPGIAGYRRRASEQLWFEAERAGIRNGGAVHYYWFEHIHHTEPDPFFHPDKGDIKVTAVLHDSLTRQAWEDRLLRHMITLKKEGEFSPADALEGAKILVGNEPTWSATAIVYGDEQFAAPGRKDKWDRGERAEKRSEKWCLKKRFSLNIPEPVEGFDVDVIEGEVHEVTEERKSAAQIMGQLGYDNPNREAGTVKAPLGAPASTDTTVERPYTPEVLQRKLVDHSIRLTAKGEAPQPDDYKVVASVLTTTMDGDEDKRHALMKYLTGFASSKDVPGNMILALKKWLDVETFGDVPNHDSITEARAAYVQAIMEQGQLELGIPSEQQLP